MNELIINNTYALANHMNANLFDSWIEYLDGSAATIKTYTNGIKRFARWMIENAITNPTRKNILDYKKFLDDNYKDTTVNNYMCAVKLFFQWTDVEELYPDVAKHIKAGEIDKGFKKDYLTTKQVAKLLSIPDVTTLKGKRDYAILALMLTTGLRVMEVAGANVTDLKPFDDDMALYIRGKGRKGKTDMVIVPEQTLEIIRDYQREARKIYKYDSDKDCALFQNVSNGFLGRRLTSKTISKTIKTYMNQIGLDDDRYTAHSLRHTAAVHALKNGCSISDVKEMMRHQSESTTLIYAHNVTRSMNKSEQTLANALLG